MKKLLVVFSMIYMSLCAYGQKDSSAVSVSVGFDAVSSYVWRGLEFDDSPNVQPYASVGYKGFSVMVWGSYAPWNDYSETDIFLSYSVGNLTLGLNDYYSKVEDGYMKWDNDLTDHTVEASLIYSGFAKSFPLNFTLGTFVYGLDKSIKHLNRQNYSTYFEIEKPISLKVLDLSVFVGGTPWSGYYADKAAVVNVGAKALKEFELTPSLTLPLSVSAVVNPNSKDMFLVGSVGLCFSK